MGSFFGSLRSSSLKNAPSSSSTNEKRKLVINLDKKHTVKIAVSCIKCLIGEILNLDYYVSQIVEQPNELLHQFNFPRKQFLSVLIELCFRKLLVFCLELL